MNATRYQTFRKGDVMEIFEVGFRSFVDGCTHVLNQETGQLETILAIDTFYCEGQEHTQIETWGGRTYDLDGTALLARQWRRASPSKASSRELAHTTGSS